tara:strand:- start:1336 stop:2289 length:954 start_codon:yes stop_codon:yes gene_type:complete
MDLRKKENREFAFKEWCSWSIKHKDCDSALWMLNYLFKRFEHNIEQRYWVSWIYGTTYYLPTAWIIWNEFPDFHLVDQDRLEQWNADNYKRLRYQTDTKYNKGYLPKQFESYKKWIHYKNEDKTQQTRFKTLLEKNSFNFVWNSTSKNLYKFGRYSTWYYLQTLNECVNLDIQPNNLKLSDYSGSKSHRNGLCLALGLDEWVDQKLDKDCIMYLEQEAKRIKAELPCNMNLYQMETLLCSFKKIFRKSRGRYLGYYLDRQAEEIIKVEQDEWKGIDWNVFWQGREEILERKLYQNRNIRKELFKVFLDTGTMEYNTL